MEEMEATEPWQRSRTGGQRISGRWLFLGVSALCLVLLAVLPPLISVNRYQRRVATAISTSLGRPVHFDRVTLNLLPVPGLMISNFVVEEDPAFGAEPMIRADTVRADLRVSSLWRRRVEVSRISFTDPSVNLVHDARGKWNFQGILLQAAQIETAPTAQRSAGSAPRFPYIEATGARINFKQGVEKTPFSLSEADFALWLPDPQSWRMRLKARPVRTDTSVSDTGSLQMEATLGRAASLEAVPMDVQATWRDAPLGQASRLLVARDLDLRGDMTVTAGIHGDLSHGLVQTRVQVNGLRRSDFVPEQTVSMDVACTGTALRMFHELSDLRCSWPVPDGDGATVAMAGSVPDTLRMQSADVQVGVARLPASVLLQWVRVVSSHIPTGLTATGLVSASVSHAPESGRTWTGQATAPELRLAGGTLASAPLVIEGLGVHSAEQVEDAGYRWRPGGTGAPAFVLGPVSIPMGGKEPAVLEGSADGAGYSLHLSGMVVLSRLVAAGAAVPQLGDGLGAVLPTNRTAGAVRVDLTSHRAWGGEQVWTDNLAHAPVTRPVRAKTGRRAR